MPRSLVFPVLCEASAVCLIPASPSESVLKVRVYTYVYVYMATRSAAPPPHPPPKWSGKPPPSVVWVVVGLIGKPFSPCGIPFSPRVVWGVGVGVLWVGRDSL